MELRQLRDFVTLAEELHYARAAARLGIDQSPLSRRIKEFEQGLGVLLFARTSRGTQLTPRGQFLLPWARSLLAAADHVERLLQSSPPIQEQVRVALCDDVPSRDLFPALAAFQQMRSSTTVTHIELSCTRQYEEIRSELTDVGFGLFAPKGVGLMSETLWPSNACIVLPHGHRLAQASEIGAREIGDAKIGLLERDASDPMLRSHLESLSHCVTTSSDLTDSPSLKVLLGMVLSGGCLGIVGPAQAEMIQPVDFAVRPIAHPRARFVTHMIYRERERNPAVRSLIESVREAKRSGSSTPSEIPGRAP